MKRNLKFALVIFIIVTILSGNTTVFAKEIMNEVTSEKVTTSEANQNKEKEVESVNTTTKPKTEKKTDETSNGKLTKKSDEVLQKVPTENMNEVSQNTTTETSEEVSGKAPVEKSDETSKETEKEKTGETSENVSKEESNQTSNQTFENTAEGTSEADDKTDEVTQNLNDQMEKNATILKEKGEPLKKIVADTSKLKGMLELSIDLRLPQTTMPTFNVSLKKTNQTNGEVATKANGIEKEKQLFYTFKDLDAGTYVLTVEGTGYETFKQKDIEIKANTRTELHLTNGYDGLAAYTPEGEKENEEQEAAKGKLGVIGTGDVDGNKDINEQDITAIIDRMESGKSAGSNYTYDLNKDGQIDIVDISYAAINKNHSFIGAAARYITNINTNMVTATAETGSIASSSNGTIKDVLENNDKHVTLQPADTQKLISEENPINIAIDIKEDTAQTQLLSIAPSSDVENNITEGTIIVDGYNVKTNEEVKIECKIGGNGKKLSKVKSLGKLASYHAIMRDVTSSIQLAATSIEGEASIDSNGVIVVDFGDVIAVKRVFIHVTGTTSNHLADISKVEFLNGMEDKIPEPELNIPQLRKADIDASITEESFMVKWDTEPNVTGYQVSITANLGGTEITQVFDVDGHQIKIEQFNGKSIKDLLDQDPTSEDFTVYHVKVRSVNGEWHSPYSEAYPVKPKPTSVPNAPTGVTLKGGYQQMKVSWNADPRATSYIVEYKQTNGDKDFEVVTPVTTKYNPLTKKDETIGIKETAYTITGLSSEVTQYSVRVKACNSLGVSKPSLVATASTLAVQEVELPTYRKINTSKGNGVLSSHIKNITFNANNDRVMKDSPLDTDKNSAKGVADNSFGSYLQVNDWDWGGFYSGSDKGVTVEFDQAYKMNYITVAKVQWNGDLGYARVWYYDCNEGTTKGKLLRADASQVMTRTDPDGNKYTMIKLQQPIYTNKMTVSIGNASTGNRDLTIAEMGFYEYDEIETQINALFKDGMHLELADDIRTEAAKESLKTKISTFKNQLNNGIAKQGGKEGEKDYHPDKDALLSELETAELLLKNANLGKVTKINSQVTKWYDSHIEFSGSLSSFQPLGVSARAGEEITIYVGNPYKNVGESTRLQLIATQWRAEGEFQKTVISELQVGVNKITIPEMIQTAREKGGSLYINYTGLKDDDPFRYIDRNYAVRVAGGIQIPMLDLSSKEDVTTGNRVAMTEAEKRAAVLEYVKELDTVVPSLEKRHSDECKDYKGEDECGIQDCLLGLTEIVLDPMMYSVSSKQIYDGLTEKVGENATTQQKADALYNSLMAMDEMMNLFYSQKGLVKQGVSQNTNAYGSNNTYPRARQNIRCMRMTGRAFMYAGSLHIGIQWNEVKDLAKGVPMKVDTEGKETADSEGNYFGWGIAHEIGHVINQQAYVHGEVTNNYFSILAQTDNTRDTVRFKYEDVYAKVTSGKVGKAQNVFTQLGLYWQLHLAYDRGGYNYKKYTTQQNQFDNSIYARIDTYARNIDKAPTPTHDKGIKLTIDSDTDNNLMRLACAATKKNILAFFEKWGMIPNEQTVQYAEQWDKEEKAIWYVNDEARNYVLEKQYPLPEDTTVLEASITNAEKNRVSSNQVNFSLNISGQNVNPNGLLGYEIIRSYKSNDEEISRAVAFVEPTINENGTVNANITYTDTIDTINNRVFTYTIVAYDKYLYEVARKQLEPVKVSHEGQISKEGWEVTTNMTSNDDTSERYSSENLTQAETSDCEQDISAVPTIADGKTETVFHGTAKSGKAEITISLPEMKKLVGLKYSGEKWNGYEIKISADGTNWTTVKKVEKGEKQDSETIYFAKIENGKETLYNYDYDCTYVKLIFEDTEVSIGEIDLLAQSGDNVEFNETGSIGKLASDFTYDQKAGYSIPADSIIFTGTYKGNPAYNVAKLWYQDETTGSWKMLNGYQIILAPDPGKADLGETSNGKWVYVVEKKELGKDGKPVIQDGIEKDNEDYTRIEKALGKGKVRVELYRVDNALTNEGERLVSDTLVTTLPSSLDSIVLTSSSTQN